MTRICFANLYPIGFFIYQKQFQNLLGGEIAHITNTIPCTSAQIPSSFMIKSNNEEKWKRREEREEREGEKEGR